MTITISTAEQADACPIGTVLLLAHDTVAVRVKGRHEYRWQITGVDGDQRLSEQNFPATILRDPTQAAPVDVVGWKEIMGAVLHAREHRWLSLSDGDAEELTAEVLNVLAGRQPSVLARRRCASTS